MKMLDRHPKLNDTLKEKAIVLKKREKAIETVVQYKYGMLLMP